MAHAGRNGNAKSLDRGRAEVVSSLPMRTALLVLLLAPAAWAGTPFFDDAWPAESFLPRARAHEVGLLSPLVARVVRAAEACDSAALIIARDGRVVAERAFGKPTGPVLQMSVSKSICSLAIGMLIAEGKIAGVDAPLSTWFPEFAAGEKAKVTLRHVLTHTTGIEHQLDPAKLLAQHDRLKFVVESPLTDRPGAVFSYSNEACQLLSGIIEKSAGEPADRYLERALFAPLGIAGARWDRDPAGNVATFGGLRLEPRQLFRIGEMLLAGGRWQGRQIVAADWLAESTAPASDDIPTCGYLWWIQRAGSLHRVRKERLDALAAAGFSGTRRLRLLTGIPFPRSTLAWKAMLALLDDRQRAELIAHAGQGRSPLEEQYGRVIGFSANGLLGQYLAVYPRKRVLAVRQRRWVPGESPLDSLKNSCLGFFEELELMLLGSSVRLATYGE
jgi:CubicO group peptidase (beta-lactamase class C family)